MPPHSAGNDHASSVLRTRPIMGNIACAANSCIPGATLLIASSANTKLVSQLVGGACCRLHAHVACDSGQHESPDTAAAQLQIQLRSMKRIPLALGNHDVVRRYTSDRPTDQPSLRGNPPGGIGRRRSTGCLSASAKSAAHATRVRTTGALDAPGKPWKGAHHSQGPRSPSTAQTAPAECPPEMATSDKRRMSRIASCSITTSTRNGSYRFRERSPVMTDGPEMPD